MPLWLYGEKTLFFDREKELEIGGNCEIGFFNDKIKWGGGRKHYGLHILCFFSWNFFPLTSGRMVWWGKPFKKNRKKTFGIFIIKIICFFWELRRNPWPSQTPLKKIPPRNEKNKFCSPEVFFFLWSHPEKVPFFCFKEIPPKTLGQKLGGFWGLR